MSNRQLIDWRDPWTRVNGEVGGVAWTTASTGPAFLARISADTINGIASNTGPSSDTGYRCIMRCSATSGHPFSLWTSANTTSEAVGRPTFSRQTGGITGLPTYQGTRCITGISARVVWAMTAATERWETGDIPELKFNGGFGGVAWTTASTRPALFAGTSPGTVTSTNKLSGTGPITGRPTNKGTYGIAVIWTRNTESPVLAGTSGDAVDKAIARTPARILASAYGSGHETAAVLLPGFAINW